MEGIAVPWIPRKCQETAISSTGQQAAAESTRNIRKEHGRLHSNREDQGISTIIMKNSEAKISICISLSGDPGP